MSDHRPVWLSEELCGCVYMALAQAYPTRMELADEFHARWKVAPADAFKVVQNAILAHANEDPAGVGMAENHTRAVLRALGAPEAPS